MLHRQIIYKWVIFRGYVIVKLPKGTDFRAEVQKAPFMMVDVL
jgi:hypothetical protein